ncbi:MAG TPA: hypothetical protein VJN94_14795 [Candidatus Binataceae bacterium]|nr:hypothetical protein [Candidatus Binataceae bacterium]
MQQAAHNGSVDRKPSPPITIVLCGGDEERRNQARAVLGQVGEIPTEVLDSSVPDAEARADVYVVMLSDDRETWNLQIMEWAQTRDIAVPVVAAINDHSIEAVRQALRAGAADVVFVPFEASDLSRALVKVGEKVQQSGASSALICSLTSIAGGVGVSTLTVAVGLALLRLTKKRVALVDLGLQSGALAALLDLDPQHSISELVDPTTTIDSLRLESVLCSHKSGLYLLAAPKQIEESELVSVNTVTSTLALMRELFDVVLIDGGHHMTEGSVAAWEQSQRLFYVVEQSVTSVRSAQRFLDLFERLQANEADLQFVLNRYDAGNPFTVEKIETALRRPLWEKIPRDDSSFIQLQLEGADLAQVAPRSPAREVIDRIARELGGNVPAANLEHGSGWLRRLRSAVRL